jgi:hypothetical protein
MRAFPHVITVTLLACLIGNLTGAETLSYRTTPGEIISKEMFDGTTLPSAWKASKGTWTLVDGSLNGQEKAEDMHAGVFVSKLALPASLIITADVRFEGASNSSMVFNGPDGHICRVSMNPKGFSVSGEKVKSDEADKSVSFGKVEQAFTNGQWYHFTIEITNDEILVFTDAKHVVYGKHAKVARAKNAFALTVGKSSIRYDNISIRAADPNTDWAQRKAELGIQ